MFPLQVSCHQTSARTIDGHRSGLQVTDGLGEVFSLESEIRALERSCGSCEILPKRLVVGGDALLSAKVRVSGSHRLERTSETLVVLEVKKELRVKIRKWSEGVAWAVWCESQHDGWLLK